MSKKEEVEELGQYCIPMSLDELFAHLELGTPIQISSGVLPEMFRRVYQRGMEVNLAVRVKDRTAYVTPTGHSSLVTRH